MSPSLPDLARDRYGRRPPWSRRRALAAAGVALAVAVAWLAWVAVRTGSPEISWQDVGFRVLSDGAAQVTFDVTFAARVAPARTAVCTLQAQNVLHTEVGRLDVAVGPAADRRQRITRRLATSEQATSARVETCAVR